MQKKPIEALIKLVGGDAEPEKMTSNKLLPCPFCGGEAEERIKVFRFCSKICIHCTVCQASKEFIPASVDYCAKDKAVEAWNRRVTDEEKDGKQNQLSDLSLLCDCGLSHRPKSQSALTSK